MTKEELMIFIMKSLHQENVEPHLQKEIISTVGELLNYYSVEYVQELLPSLLKQFFVS